MEFIWVPDKQNLWIIARIMHFEEEKGLVVCKKVIDNSVLNVPKSVVHPVDPSHLEDLDNLIKMNNLHEAPLLDLLRRRFHQHRIYTFTGNVLISINPYQVFPSLYEHPEKFFNVKEDNVEEDDKKFPEKLISKTSPALIDSFRNSSNVPHIYEIANETVRDLIMASNYEINNKTSTTTTVTEIHSSINIDDLLSAPIINMINQSIIVSGESGAGKTEASKQIINFLIKASNLTRTDGNSNDLAAERLKSVLIDSGIVLESFGNSKTVRNDNSSRFGKYIKLRYGQDNTLLSAYTETFLLEKSRLVNVGQGERNYHIFYQLIQGLPQIDKALHKTLKMDQNVNSFRILFNGDVKAVDSTSDDSQEFLATHKALETLLCSSVEIKELISILGCILHLGNSIVQRNDTGNDQEMLKVMIETMDISFLAQLLGLMPSLLLQCLATQKIVIPGRSSIKLKILNEKEVRNNIHALMKWMYNKVFDWLIRKVNARYYEFAGETAGGGGKSNTLSQITMSQDEAETEYGSNTNKFIGILDIFGFEILGVNSFEQLCINYTNERLQQQFNEYIFMVEQQIYRDEGLNWNEIAFSDNQHVIDLIGKKPHGLLNILEEHGLLNRDPDDNALLVAYNQMYSTATTTATATGGNALNTSSHSKTFPPPPPPISPKSKELATVLSGIHLSPSTPAVMTASHAYHKSRFTDGTFIIKHFAGEVTYSIEGFLVKNNDSLQDDLLDLLSSSTNVFLRNCFGVGELSPTGAGYTPGAERLKTDFAAIENESPKKSSSRVSNSFASSNSLATAGSKKIAALTTVSFNFRNQLDLLMETLRKTKPHYVKCIKPNAFKSPRTLEADLVMEQLRYSGILEVVRIRREGFPMRMKFRSFYAKYEILLYGQGIPSARNCTDKEAKTACQRIAETWLALTTYQLGWTQIFVRDGCFKLLDHQVRKFHNEKSTLIQARVRTFLFTTRYKKALIHIKLVQSLVRKFVARKKFEYNMYCIKFVQRFLHTKHLRNKFIIHYKKVILARQKAAVAKIWFIFNGFKQRKVYLHMKELTLNMISKLYAYQLKRKAQQKFLVIRKKIIKIQSCFRRYLAYQIYRVLLKRKRNLELRSVPASKKDLLEFCQKEYRRRNEDVSDTLIAASRISANLSKVSLDSQFHSTGQRKSITSAMMESTDSEEAEAMTFRTFFLTIEKSIVRIQTAVRTWMTNTKLRQILMSTHTIIIPKVNDSVNVKFDTQSLLLMNQVIAHPWLKYVRNKWLSYCTIYQSMLKLGNYGVIMPSSPSTQTSSSTSMLRALPTMTLKNILDVDILDRNSLHYLCSAEFPSYEVLEYLTSLIHQYANSMKSSSATSNGSGQVIDDDDDDNDEETTLTSGGGSEKGVKKMKAVREALTKSLRLDILKEGWISKKRQGGLNFNLRWAVLTAERFSYYQDKESMDTPSFSIPVKGISVNRIQGEKPTLEVSSDQMKEKRSIFGTEKKKSLIFMLENEKELQEWLLHLRGTTGSVGELRKTSIRYVSTTLREYWVTRIDKTGCTALHRLLMNPKLNYNLLVSEKDASVSLLLHVVQIASWMIENGCPVNAQNNDGQTALHIAMENTVFPEIIYCLFVKGGEIYLADKFGTTVSHLIQKLQNQVNVDAKYVATLQETMVKFDRKLMQSLNPAAAMMSGDNASHNRRASLSIRDSVMSGIGANKRMSIASVSTPKHVPSSDAPGSHHSPYCNVVIDKIKGYSYLSLHFRSLLVKVNSVHIAEPVLIIALYNKQMELMEEKVELKYPVLDLSVYKNHSAVNVTAMVSKASSLENNFEASHFLGFTWNMQTPLENIEPGAFVIFELKDMVVPTSAPNTISNATSNAMNPSSKYHPIAWGVFKIDSSSIDSRLNTQYQLKYPGDAPIDVNSNSAVSSSALHQNTSGKATQSTQRLSSNISNTMEAKSNDTESFVKIEVDTILSRKEKKLIGKA